MGSVARQHLQLFTIAVSLFCLGFVAANAMHIIRINADTRAKLEQTKKMLSSEPYMAERQIEDEAGEMYTQSKRYGSSGMATTMRLANGDLVRLEISIHKADR
jgi:hypothetical protein